MDLRRYAYDRDELRRRPQPDPVFSPDDPQSNLLFTLACDRFHYHLMRTFDSRWERILSRMRHRQAQRRNYDGDLLAAERKANWEVRMSDWGFLTGRQRAEVEELVTDRLTDQSASCEIVLDRQEAQTEARGS